MEILALVNALFLLLQVSLDAPASVPPKVEATESAAQHRFYAAWAECTQARQARLFYVTPEGAYRFESPFALQIAACLREHGISSSVGNR